MSADPRPFGDDAAALAAFDSHPDLMLVVSGPEHRIRAANRAVRRFVPGTDLVGRPLLEPFSELAGQQVLELYATCFRTGRGQRGREWRIDLDVDGTGLREHYFDFEMVPWRDDTDEVIGVLARGSDVTEQVRRRLDVEQASRFDRHRLHEARDVLATLQDALLPAGTYVLPRVDVAASYLLAEQATSAGGDWFDSLPTAGGRVSLVVGDVVGHGVGASAVMGHLRAALACALLEDDDPAAALRRLDRLAAIVPDALAATACAVTLDPATGFARYCCAGHPPPLVLKANSGEPTYLAPIGGSPLGMSSGYTAGDFRLGPGDAVLLYSDGLLERPGRSPAQATVELAQVADESFRGIAPGSAEVSTVDRLCRVTLEQLVRLTGHDDDVTVLAAQLRPRPVAPLDVTMPAGAESIGDLRRSLIDWVSPLALDPVTGMALLHATGELVSNAVEHAYQPATAEGRTRDRTVRLEAHLTGDGTLEATVTDHGCWRGPDVTASGRGRGLAMAEQLVDRLDLHVDGGTSATMTIRPLHPAQLLTSSATGSATGPVPASAPFTATVVEAATPLVTITGPVDLTGADDLRRVLASVGTAGNARGAVVDLTGASLLGSAGVQALVETLERRAVPLRLVAAPGSPADHVLTLVQLAHDPAV